MKKLFFLLFLMFWKTSLQFCKFKRNGTWEEYKIIKKHTKGILREVRDGIPLFDVVPGQIDYENGCSCFEQGGYKTYAGHSDPNPIDLYPGDCISDYGKGSVMRFMMKGEDIKHLWRGDHESCSWKQIEDHHDIASLDFGLYDYYRERLYPEDSLFYNKPHPNWNEYEYTFKD
ncbi:MAG: hypothetical protein EOP00_27830 [Pedobacter sp.]|nr:MAG: hypothetical protein EOP00_27830 [Pedobacter sp.]